MENNIIFISAIKNMVIKEHIDIFKKLINIYPEYLEKLKTVTLKIGRVTYNKRGHYSWTKNEIQINKHYINEIRTTKDVLESIIKVMYHELIHIFIRDHDVNFKYYNNQFRNSIYNNEKIARLLAVTKIMCKPFVPKTRRRRRPTYNKYRFIIVNN